MSELAGTSDAEATLKSKYDHGILTLGPRRYRIKYDVPPSNGRKRQRKTETLIGVTAKQARAILEKRRVEARSPNFVGDDALTVSEMLDEFIQKKRLGKEQTTLTRYESLIKLYLRPAFGHLKLRQLKPAHLTDAYDQWIVHGRAGRIVSPKTVRHAHDLLRNAINFSVRRGYVLSNVATLVDHEDLPKAMKPKPKALSEAELRLLLNEAKNPTTRSKKRGYVSSQPWFFPAVAFAAYTGCRRGEVLALRWADLDLEARLATIARSITERLEFKRPKNDRIRTLTIPTALVGILREHKDTQRLERDIMRHSYRDADLVFALADGSPIDPWNFGRAVRDLINRAGVTRITLHGLRDTHASLLAKAGVSLEVVSKRLGHSSIAITAERYLDVYQDRDAEAAQAFERLIG